jgi:hypothetical protein
MPLASLARHGSVPWAAELKLHVRNLMANEFRVLRGQSGFQAIKQDLFANGLAQESDCPRCQHLRARRLIGISSIRPRRLKRAARLIRTSRYVVRSDMNSRFLLTNLSAFCIANRGREDHFFFADPPRVMSACARKGSLDIRHPHLGFNRVGNETIFMGGMMHLIELFRTGLSVVAPRNLWA